MKKGIVFSEKDLAGKNVAKALLEKGFKKRGDFRESPVYEKKDLILTSVKEDVTTPLGLDELARDFSLDAIVMASRHRSESGKPTLTVHPTGNFGEALYGGQAKTLQYANANLMRNIFLELLEDPPRGYAVSLEATHHGPTEFQTPLVFAELGSSEKQWQDGEAAGFLAEAILKGLGKPDRVEAVIAFGGGHYCPKFSVHEKELAFGHICPKYAVDLLDQNLIRQMVEKTVDDVARAVLDEKGLKGRQKALVKGLLHGAGVEF